LILPDIISHILGMHLEILAPLFVPIPGSASRTTGQAENEKHKPGLRMLDLLFHVPTSQVCRHVQPGVMCVPDKTLATLRVTVDRHHMPRTRNRRAPYRIFVYDETGAEIVLVYFSPKPRLLEKLLPVGEVRWISGTVQRFQGCPQMVHPEYIARDQDLDRIPEEKLIYKPMANMSGTDIACIISKGMRNLPKLPEWLENKTILKNNWPTFIEAIVKIHTPSIGECLDTQSRDRAIERLAYDEVLASQLALLATDWHHNTGVKQPITEDKRRLLTKILSDLPFSLTSSQTSSLKEIISDMRKPRRMIRLLQGDVGSGKTVVGMLAGSVTIENGRQVAFMVPTDLLARQHFETCQGFGAKAGIRIAILTAREQGTARKQILSDVANGNIDLLIGTHAIIQKTVVFKDLGFVIIDEQHRFGVEQRLSLLKKSCTADLLIMTATPIPRTTLMTLLGNVSVSRLTERPGASNPILTYTISSSRSEEIVERLGIAIRQGAKVYWICPLVEKSETSDLSTATERHRYLSERLGPTVGLVHGKMKKDEQVAAMDDFITGRTQVLVATTVVEVGLDVPDASIMIIEQAQRFGLAQLHQLRGRIGRRGNTSHCVLQYTEPVSEVATARLNTIKNTNDGFLIAEEDLNLRGGGDIMGIRQSGMFKFRLARDLALQHKFLPRARDEAHRILTSDPYLSSPRGQALRLALSIFEQRVQLQ